MYEKEFERIINASRNHSLTFFVGAGISALSKAPSWKELIQNICRELKISVKETYSSDEYLKIPQMYYYFIEKNNDKYYDFIEKSLVSTPLFPNEIHKELLNFNPISFITTNFDDLLEEAAIQYCQGFKVIACDDEVSSINGDRYILKLHGDLKHKNIVFKEEDYLNYSENFKLIETLLKSIFSTNTVVFIGYGLNDYNIKLILNWAKTLLKDHFNKPIFIYTDDDSLSAEELLYQESRGLCVIEYEKLSKHTDDYFTRYISVLKAIRKSSDFALDNKTEEEAFSVLFELLEPLNKLNALRIKDVYAKLSSYDMSISEDGTIYVSSGKSILIQYFHKICNMSIEEYNTLPDIIQKKFQIILKVFTKAKIGRIKVNGIICPFINSSIPFADSNCLSFDYMKMIAITSKEFSETKSKYRKAFYFARLSQYDKAFYLFSEVASISFKIKDYLLYYFAEINCINLYKIIKSVNMYHNCYDMKKIDTMVPTTEDIQYLFERLPIEFQNKYASLKDLYSANLLYQYSYEAFVDGQKLQNAIESNTRELGLTSSTKVICRINDYLHFLIDNGIVVDLFSEFQNTIKNLLSLLVYKYSVQGNNQLSPQMFPDYWQDGISFDAIDFYCFIEYFSDKEIVKLFNKYNVDSIIFNDLDIVETMAMNIIKYYDYIIKNRVVGIRAIDIQKQFKNLLTLLRYIDISQNLVENVCRFIFKYEFSDILINDKILFLDHQIFRRKRYSKVTSQIIENKLLAYIDAQIGALKNLTYFEIRSTNSEINYYNLIHYIDPDNEEYYSRRIANRVSIIISNNLSEMIPHIVKHYWSYISSYSRYKVSSWAKKELSVNFRFDLFTLLLECNAKIDRNILGLLKDYLRNLIRENSLDSKDNGIITYPISNPYEDLEQVGYWCLTKNLHKKDFEEFVGVSAAFDFYFQYDKFDFNKFDVSWLLNLYPHTLKEIAKNKRVKEKIRISIAQLLEKGNVLNVDKTKLQNILTKYFC